MKKERISKENKSSSSANEKSVKIYERKWYVVDAKNKILGRLSTRVANLLSGKGKVEFTKYQDKGDNVVVINAVKVAVSGNKEKAKKYYRYSGYPGGLKVQTFEEVRQKNPERLIVQSVSGMLPKNRLGKSMIKKLYVYPKDTHPHEAQKPIKLDGKNG